MGEKERKKEGKIKRKSENISKKREIRWKKRGKRPHITGPHLFFYEEKLTGIWALSKMKKKCYIYSIKSEKRL